jgi:hypothetical protein
MEISQKKKVCIPVKEENELNALQGNTIQEQLVTIPHSLNYKIIV